MCRITFQCSHRFQLTNSGTNSVLNRSNSPRPLLAPSLARPTNSPTYLHIGIFQANPVSFFPNSSSFNHNRSEPRRTDQVRLSYENPSDPFGFAEARTRKLGLWLEFLDLGFLGSLRRMRVVSEWS